MVSAKSPKLLIICLVVALYLFSWSTATADQEYKAQQNTFNPELTYLMLVAEMAIQREQYDVGLDYYIEATERSRSPDVAERATQLAISLDNYYVAMLTVRLWADGKPEDKTAQQLAAALFLAADEFHTAKHYLTRVLDTNQDNAELSFAEITLQLNSEPHQQKLLAISQEIAASKKYRNNPIAHLAVAHVASQMNDLDSAVAAIEQTLAVKPDLTKAMIIKSELLKAQAKDAQAISFLHKQVKAFPKNTDLRIYLAENLIQTEDFANAKKHLVKLSSDKEHMGLANTYLAKIYLSENDYKNAEKTLKLVLHDDKYANTARYYLGNIAEQQQQNRQAVYWFKQILEGHYHVTSHILAAKLQAQEGKVDEALNTINAVTIETIEQMKQVYMAQTEILINAERNEQAYGVLVSALERFDGDADLLYARGIVAEKLDRLEQMERDFLAVIQLSPEHTDALNALGYVLADRTERYDESMQYLSQALKLAPNNPDVIDSMGWLHYRLGELDKAKDFLHRALELKNDAHIAAHLGEVLWAMGEQDDAMAIWNQGLKDHPEHEELHDRINRFVVPSMKAVNLGY